jgi:hypothetical protein
MTDVDTTVTLRCIGGPYDSRYETLPYTQEALQVPNQDRMYRRFGLGWVYGGMSFHREVLLWEGIEGDDALVILMRKFVSLLDQHQL